MGQSHPINKMPRDGVSRDDVRVESHKSRQERVRDNQRRSRARRQERLQELERRLSECHTACRDAELQREAFHDLQTENSRLRELLSRLGVRDEAVERFVRQENQSHPDPASTAQLLRPLKPRFNAPLAPVSAGPSTNDHFPPLAASSPRSSCSPSAASGATCPAGTSAATIDNFLETLTPATRAASAESGPPMSLWETVPINDSFLTGSFQDGQVNRPPVFHCTVFGVKASGPLRPPDENNTTPCNVAKQLIEQCNIVGHDLDKVKMRLATGFAPCARPGESCRVSNQVLSEVLQEILMGLS